ncbi:MAG: peptidoglycan-associated lipoprotein Pal [Desulfatibacillaceae bacterium]
MHRRTWTWIVLLAFGLALFAGTGCQVVKNLQEKYGKKEEAEVCPPAREPAPPEPAEPAEPAPPEPAAPSKPVVEPVPVPAAPAEEGPTASAIARFEARNVHFEFDSSTLDNEARVVLRQKAAFLKEYPRFNVLVEGHCDERGSNEYNLALGERRAWAAKEYLVGLGVAPDRLATVSYGEERPLDPRHTEEAWARNRRAAFDLK